MRWLRSAGASHTTLWSHSPGRVALARQTVNRLEPATMPNPSSSLLPTGATFSSPWGRWLGALLLMCALALPARADPPARVGRLAETQGQVWAYDAQANEWVTAERNRPVTSGDRLSTEGDGRAELRIGSTTLRLGAGTELEVVRLDDERLSLLLHGGSLAARLRTREAAGEFELVTADGRFRTDRAGHYRFDHEGDTSRAAVLSGQLQFQSPDSGVFLNAGQEGEFWREGGTQHSVGELRRDEFLDWVASRDQGDDRGVSARYVSPEMTGVEDLDRYGRWEQTAEYGAVWTPLQVSSGWAPYRTGHWAWVGPWGWTWVDDAPWGFAPFHYGRWVLHRNAWCWAPGQYVARPVYAPALVAWVGHPSGPAAGRRGPAPTVGWFPLAPREVYVPGHRFSPGYLRNVNRPHVGSITHIDTIVRSPGTAVERNHYRYRDLPQALTRVPVSVIERRQPVAPAIVRAQGPLLRNDGGHPEAVRVMPPVSPGRQRPPGAVPPAPGSIHWGHEGREAGGHATPGRSGGPAPGFATPAPAVPGRFESPAPARPAPQPVAPPFGQGVPPPGAPLPGQSRDGHGRGERWNRDNAPTSGAPRPLAPSIAPATPAQNPAFMPPSAQPHPRREFGDDSPRRDVRGQPASRRDVPGRVDEPSQAPGRQGWGRPESPPPQQQPQQPRPEWRREGGGGPAFAQPVRPAFPQPAQPQLPPPQPAQTIRPQPQPQPQPQAPQAPQLVRPQPQPPVRPQPAAPEPRREHPGVGGPRFPGHPGDDNPATRPRQVN